MIQNSFGDDHTKKYDSLIKDKIMSLMPSRPRYYDDIMRLYFEELQQRETLGHFSLEDRYKIVLNCISKLWLSSEKSPSVFKDVKDFEPILLKISGYRDHFIHSFNVFLLGYYIINRLKELLPTFYWSNDHNLTWMLTATFHDVAYSIQEMESWLNLLFKKFLGVDPKFHYNITQVMPITYLDFMRLISRWHKNSYQIQQGDDIGEIDWTFYNELGSKLVEKDHSVLGSLMLAHLLAVKEGFADGQKWDFLYNHLPACHAISLHHLSSVAIEFYKHPFAFLLALCDELQDEGRPSTQPNRDIIYIDDIDIVNTSIPEIQFKIEISEKRRKDLVKVLNRLHSREIKLIIKDMRNDLIFSTRP